jgi:hypothetical protein
LKSIKNIESGIAVLGIFQWLILTAQKIPMLEDFLNPLILLINLLIDLIKIY